MGRLWQWHSARNLDLQPTRRAIVRSERTYDERIQDST